jgi:HSP20 family protein
VAGTLTRWDPFAELGDLRSRFDRLFDDAIVGDRRAWTPSIDVVRNADNIVIRADIPGIKPEDVKIEIQDDILTITGEHEERTEKKDEQYVRRERRYGGFSRSMVLPAGVDATKIEAKTQNGVVEVTIPLPTAAKKEPITITPTSA